MLRVPDPPSPGCRFNRQTLTAFLQGRASHIALQETADHLGQCTRFVDILNQLQEEHPLLTVGLVRNRQTFPFLAEPEWTQLQTRAAGLSLPHLDPPSPLSDERRLRQYVLLELLGQGGMGSVYRARNIHLDKVVALKTLRLEKLGGAQILDRFRREMKAIGGLNHPNIVQALDGGEEAGNPYLVMELAEGLDLHRLTVRCGPLEVADACEVIHQAALGLQHIYEHGLIHRDIKPSNLLVTVTGQVKVLDLGLARQTTLAADTDAGPITEAGQVVGTADFMAPEQALDAHQANIRSDLYSLGCTLYKLLSGHAPFEGAAYNSSTKKILAHMKQDVPALGPQRADVPGEVLVLLRRMLAKEPDDRPATPAEVADAFRPFTTGANLSALVRRGLNPGEARPLAVPANVVGSSTQETLARSAAVPLTGPALPPPRPVRRRRGVIWGGVGVALVVVAVMIGGWFLPAPQAVQEKPGRSPQTANKPAAGELRERWTPGTLHNLLDHSPFATEGDPNARNTHWRYLAERQELVLSTDEVKLTPLGKVQGMDYRLQAIFKQNRNWTGGTGFYFGHQAAKRNGQWGQQYFTITLTEYRKTNPPVTPFKLDWFQTWHVDGGVGGDRLYLKSEPVVQPPEEVTLEICVEGQKLKTVRWDNEARQSLVIPAAILPPPIPTDYDGTFGFFSEQSSSTYRNATFRVFERNRP